MFALHEQTFSTVGYGDITPTSDIGKMVDCCFILLAIIIIPAQISQLSVQLSKRSRKLQCA